MAQEERKAEQAAEASAEVREESLLDAVISVTQKQETRDETVDWLKRLVERATAGEVKWDKSLTRTLQKAIDAIDRTVSKQVAAILHHPDFQKLEGTWRGFHRLVHESETGTQLKIKVLNASKREI